MSEATKPDKTRQLSQEQMNSIEHLLQGRSDRSVAEAVSVSRQTVWEWRNHDPLFIAELNRQRYEMWKEAHERLKSLANRALDGKGRDPFKVDFSGIEDEVDSLAKSRLKKAMAEAGLS
jgi:Icc-related predicted phosphoesterase